MTNEKPNQEPAKETKESITGSGAPGEKSSNSAQVIQTKPGEGYSPPPMDVDSQTDGD